MEGKKWTEELAEEKGGKGRVFIKCCMMIWLIVVLEWLLQWKGEWKAVWLCLTFIKVCACYGEYIVFWIATIYNANNTTHYALTMHQSSYICFKKDCLKYFFTSRRMNEWTSNNTTSSFISLDLQWWTNFSCCWMMPLLAMLHTAKGGRTMYYYYGEEKWGAFGSHCPLL